MIHQNIKQKEQLIDPIGAAEVLSILALSVQVVSTFHQFGNIARRDKRISRLVLTLKDDVYGLQNALDDLVEVLKRQEEYSNKSILQSKITIRKTLMDLKGRDYRRYMTIKDELRKVESNIIRTTRTLDSINQSIFDSHNIEHFDENLISSFDYLLKSFSDISIGSFIKQLQKELNLLSSSIDRVRIN